MIKEKLKKWLGINKLESKVKAFEELIDELGELAVDVNFHEQSRIIVITKLKGGQIRIIPARFESFNYFIYFNKIIKFV